MSMIHATRAWPFCALFVSALQSIRYNRPCKSTFFGCYPAMSRYRPPHTGKLHAPCTDGRIPQCGAGQPVSLKKVAVSAPKAR